MARLSDFLLLNLVRYCSCHVSIRETLVFLCFFFTFQGPLHLTSLLEGYLVRQSTSEGEGHFCVLRSSRCGVLAYKAIPHDSAVNVSKTWPSSSYMRRTKLFAIPKLADTKECLVLKSERGRTDRHLGTQACQGRHLGT